MRDDQLQAGLAMLRAGMDAVLAADLTALSAVELTGLARDVEVQRRRTDAADHRQAAAWEETSSRCDATEFLQIFLEILACRPESVRPPG